MEKTNGRLRLFALIARPDLEGKWDILFSADWLEKTNSEKDLIYLIEKLKSEFGKNLDFLSRIVVAKPNEMFIQQLTKAVIRENSGQQGEIASLSTSSDFSVHIFVVAIDFTGMNLEITEGTKDGPIAIREVSNF